jgi:hypothetical protein
VRAIATLTLAAAYVGVRAAAARHRARPSEPPPADNVGPVRGNVLWEGRPGDAIPAVRVVLGDDGGPVAEATTDRAGRFELPVELPAGEYRLWIEDPYLHGSARVWLIGGPAELTLPAHERRR